MKALRKKLRRAIVATHGVPLVGRAVRTAFRIAAARAVRRLASAPGVRSVYVRHGHPGSPTFVPGLSDLDLTLVLHESAAESPSAIALAGAAVERVSRLHPYSHSSDARFTSASELARLTREYEAPFTLLVTPDDWRLAAGEEARTERARGFPAERVARHPEMNRWWREVLPRHALRRASEGEPATVRPFLRGAAKQRLHFLLARGRAPARRGGYVENRDAVAAFEDDPETQALVLGVLRDSFRTRDRRSVAAAFLRRALRDAELFFAGGGGSGGAGGGGSGGAGACGSGAAGRGPERESARDPAGAAAAAAIARRLAGCPRLASLLEGAIVYPLPFVAPAFHQADLLLPENASAERVGEILASLEEGLGGREADAEGHPFAVSLVPRAAAASPLAAAGSPFPFLAEHVALHGRSILGARADAIAPAPLASDDERRSALRDWLPCHLFTLKRRAERESRTVNALQLVAVRHYLESGEIETDALRLRERAIGADPGPAPAERQVFLSREYARVESLLREGESHALRA